MFKLFLFIAEKLEKLTERYRECEEDLHREKHEKRRFEQRTIDLSMQVSELEIDNSTGQLENAKLKAKVQELEEILEKLRQYYLQNNLVGEEESC